MYSEWDDLEDGQSYVRIDDPEKLTVLTTLHAWTEAKNTFFDQSLRYAKAPFVSLTDRQVLADCAHLMLGCFVDYSMAVYNAEPLAEERIQNLGFLVMSHEAEIRKGMLDITEDPFFGPMSEETERQYGVLFYSTDMSECPEELLQPAHDMLAANFGNLFSYFVGITTRELDY